MQRRVALWILRAFCTSPILEIKAIAGLVSIHLHLQKLSRWYQLRTFTLPKNHTIKFLLERRHSEDTSHYCLLLENMTHKQWLKIKGSVIDANNHLNGIFPTFNSLSNEFSSRTRLIDTFPSHFSFHHANCKNKESKAAYICKLDECVFHTSNNFKLVVIVSDASIKNNVAIFMAYIHLFLNPIKKMIYHVVNIMSTEAELFAIRYGIN